MHGIDVMVGDFLNQLLGELPDNMEGDNGVFSESFIVKYTVAALGYLKSRGFYSRRDNTSEDAGWEKVDLRFLFDTAETVWDVSRTLYDEIKGIRLEMPLSAIVTCPFYLISRGFCVNDFDIIKNYLKFMLKGYRIGRIRSDLYSESLEIIDYLEDFIADFAKNSEYVFNGKISL